ncbi:hypothetical protein [Candidatus Nitrospira bockiana]
MNRTRTPITLLMAAGAIVVLPLAAFGIQESTPSSTPTVVPAFPPSAKCTTNSPCQSVSGQITRIEESYWIKDANGREVHLRVTGDSKLKELPKIGDSIAAQLTSDGDVEALVKLPEVPKTPEMSAPSKRHQDIR